MLNEVKLKMYEIGNPEYTYILSQRLWFYGSFRFWVAAILWACVH